MVNGKCMEIKDEEFLEVGKNESSGRMRLMWVERRNCIGILGAIGGVVAGGLLMKYVNGLMGWSLYVVCMLDLLYLLWVGNSRKRMLEDADRLWRMVMDEYFGKKVEDEGLRSQYVEGK